LTINQALSLANAMVAAMTRKVVRLSSGLLAMVELPGTVLGINFKL
jgi:hypothetical protein